MKKKFNIYCVAMLAAILFSFALNMTDFYKGFIDGFDDGASTEVASESAAADGNSQAHEYQTFTLSVRNKGGLANTCDSITNLTTGQSEHFSMERAFFVTATQAHDFPVWLPTATKAVKCILIIMGFCACWLFIKIVLSVNRGEIFEKHVERYLSCSGWLFIATYALRWVTVYCDYLYASSIFAFERYEIVLEQPRAWILYCGIGMLLTGQVFAIARQMKEEQELTI